MEPTQIFFYASLACVAASVGLVTYVMATPDKAEVSQLGERGYQRQLARKNPIFALAEPAIRLVASWLYPFPLDGVRKELKAALRQGGNFLGLDPDEFMAMCILAGAAGAFFVSQILLDPVAIIGVSMLVGALPYVALGGVRDSRAVAITRALPNVIELLALCVSAGMDFPGGIREVIGPNAAEDDVLNAELRQMLRDMDLGHSRRQALIELRDRTGGDGIADFVAAMIQSEEKGNPLKEVLQAQARVLRIRRSFRAEELATQAGLKMVLPLAILMLMVLVIIMAPLFLKMREEGF